MGAFGVLRLALRLLLRDWRAGEFHVLALALLVATASTTGVAFFADRVNRGLTLRANELLGADLMVASDHPLEPAFGQRAQALGLKQASVLEFPSMALHGEENLLVDVKAVDSGYPLRGRLELALQPGGAAREVEGVPAPGSVWVDAKLFPRLGVQVGDRLTLGEGRFAIAAVITRDPESLVGFLNLGPRIIMNLADLPATGLVTTGSRVQYRLTVAGEERAVGAFRAFAQARIGPGQRVEGLKDARPEVRSLLVRGEKFLRLAALAAVVLSAAAVALGARRYLARHLDACAVMRCLGASQRQILALYALMLLILGAAAAASGCLTGFAAQEALAAIFAPLLGFDLPSPQAAPLAQGFAGAFALLFGFALPPLAALARVPTLRVLRRELGIPRGTGAAGYGLGALLIAGLILWEARDLQLGWVVLAGAAGVATASILISGLLVRALAGLATAGGPWRLGLANLRRKPLATAIQVCALGLGIMALLLLTLVRDDLLADWKATLPPKAPNRFLVQIQPDQVAPLKAFFSRQGIPEPELFPMVKGRLAAINGKPVSSADYQDERAKRLVDREFNLSWGEQLAPDNRIVAGRWWGKESHDEALFSVEKGIAQTLGIRLGDLLTYQIAGEQVTGQVASLREVQWDSFRVNFFVIAPPGLLKGYPTSYITSFYLPSGENAVMNALVKEFPNLLVIDVAALLAQAQGIMERMARGVQLVFLFTLAAGLLTLYAAAVASLEERRRDAAVMRVLGAANREVEAAWAAEFAALGLAAGLVAALGASAAGYGLAAWAFRIPFHPDPRLWAVGIFLGTALATLAGWAGVRRVLSHPPLETIRNEE